jgi:hypothetical protein
MDRKSIDGCGEVSSEKSNPGKSAVEFHPFSPKPLTVLHLLKLIPFT